MEPADEQNKDYSHVAHKMKWKPMKFEHDKSINKLCICICLFSLVAMNQMGLHYNNMYYMYT